MKRIPERLVQNGEVKTFGKFFGAWSKRGLVWKFSEERLVHKQGELFFLDGKGFLAARVPTIFQKIRKDKVGLVIFVFSSKWLAV